VNPQAFTEAGVFSQTIDNLAGAVEAVAPAPGVSEVMLPGGPEVRSRAERKAQGIPIAADTWDALAQTATRLGVSVPAPGQ
jgi:hydroxycarboxylate dehydrogenase B